MSNKQSNFRRHEFEEKIFRFLSRANNFSLAYSENQNLSVTQRIDGTTFSIPLDTISSVFSRNDKSEGELLQINLDGDIKLLFTPMYVGFKPDTRGSKDQTLAPKVATSGDLICLERLLIEMIMDSEGTRLEDRQDIEDIYNVYRAIFKGARQAGVRSIPLMPPHALLLIDCRFT